MTIAHHCFFSALVWTQVCGEGLVSDFCKTACAGSFSISLYASSIVTRASYLFCKGILKGKEKILLPLCAVTFFHHFLFPVTLPFPWHKADPGPASVVVMLSWLLCIIDSRVWLHWSISRSGSWILFNLLTSSCSSATKQSSSSVWSHFSQVWLQSLFSSRNIPSYTPQLEAWVVACLNGSSLCVAALVLPGARSSGEAEDVAFCWMLTILPHACLLGIYICSSIAVSEGVYPRLVQSNFISH